MKIREDFSEEVSMKNKLSGNMALPAGGAGMSQDKDARHGLVVLGLP